MKKFIYFRFSLIFLASIAVMLFASSRGKAQNCIQISGTVTTSEGKRIPAADVYVRNNKTKELRQVQTNANGEYRLICFEQGVYDIFANSKDFRQEQRKSVTFRYYEGYVIDFVLKRRRLQAERILN